MLRFPIHKMLDEHRCYEYLLPVLPPEGLRCPCGHCLPEGPQPHDRHRDPLVDSRCRECGAVFNLFTGTLWSGRATPHAAKSLLILRGVARGVPTHYLAEELEIDRSRLLDRRPKIQALIAQRLSPSLRPDAVTETEDMNQNTGEKGRHQEP